MTEFVYGETLSDELELISTALGTTSPKYTEKELGKAVKQAAAQNYIHCATNDPIEGFIRSVEPWTVNSGYAFGGIQKKGRKVAQVGATFSVSLLDIVVAAPQAAVGTESLPLVRPHTVTSGISNAGVYQWKVIRIISGDGSAGSTVLLERQ